MQWYNSDKLQNPFMTCFTFIICNLFKFLSARVHLIWKSTLRYEHEELISQCMHINWSAWHLCYSIPHIRFQPIIVPIFSSSRPFWSASLGFFFTKPFIDPLLLLHIKSVTDLFRAWGLLQWCRYVTVLIRAFL